MWNNNCCCENNNNCCENNNCCRCRFSRLFKRFTAIRQLSSSLLYIFLTFRPLYSPTFSRYHLWKTKKTKKTFEFLTESYSFHMCRLFPFHVCLLLFNTKTHNTYCNIYKLLVNPQLKLAEELQAHTFLIINHA